MIKLVKNERLEICFLELQLGWNFSKIILKYFCFKILFDYLVRIFQKSKQTFSFSKFRRQNVNSFTDELMETFLVIQFWSITGMHFIFYLVTYHIYVFEHLGSDFCRQKLSQKPQNTKREIQKDPVEQRPQNRFKLNAMLPTSDVALLPYCCVSTWILQAKVCR